MLVAIHDLMKDASGKKYAVGYFEAWNLESLLAVLDAAVETRSPIIVGFNGDFVLNPERLDRMDVRVLAAMASAAAAAADIPVGLLLNETGDYAELERCLDYGFTGIMPRSPGVEDDQYAAAVAALVRKAHDKGIWVEGELGLLPTSIDGTTGHMEQGTLTDPDEAASFVNKTGIDALAVSVGNVHHLVGETSGVDLALVRRISERVRVPLVIHGGSGLPKEQLRELVQAGMAKLNVGSCFKEAFTDGMRRALGYDGPQHLDPHMLLGTGGRFDIMTTGRLAMAAICKSYLEPLGCCGKAEGFAQPAPRTAV